MTHDPYGDCGTDGHYCSWQIEGWNNDSSQISLLGLGQDPDVWNHVYRAALEAYNNGSQHGVTNCDDYPRVCTPSCGTDPAPFINLYAYQPGTTAYDYVYITQTWQNVIHGNVAGGAACNYGIPTSTQTTATLSY